MSAAFWFRVLEWVRARFERALRRENARAIDAAFAVHVPRDNWPTMIRTVIWFAVLFAAGFGLVLLALGEAPQTDTTSVLRAEPNRGVKVPAASSFSPATKHRVTAGAVEPGARDTECPTPPW